MEKSNYILITEQFALSMNSKESETSSGSFFGYAVTIDGHYVCSLSSADDFPSEFATISPLTVLVLGSDSFPVTPPIQ